MGTEIIDWYKEERQKFEILFNLCLKYNAHNIMEEFWTYFEGTGWALTKEWKEE